MNGWRTVCRFLEQRGVSHVFGLPGTQNAELFSELEATEIAVVTCMHEMSAGFAAIGHAIASGKPGVLLTIAGPGFCFAAAPVVEARHDSVPLIHIVVRAARHASRRFQLQDIDHTGIAERMAKGCREIDTPEVLGESLDWAWHMATTGEPGPVVLLIDSWALDREQPRVGHRAPSNQSELDAQPVTDELLQCLAGKRVCIYAGRGASDASKQLIGIAETMGWPVMTTLSGRGVIPEHHRLAAVIDQRNVSQVNDFIAGFDIVLAIGVKFTHNGSAGFRLEIPRDKLIHVDSDKDVLDGPYDAATKIRASATAFLGSLSGRLTASQQVAIEPSALDADVLGRTTDPVFQTGGPVSAAEYFSALRSGFPDNAVYVTDSGLHQLLLRRHFVAKQPRQLMTPSDFQSMGFGIPAAIGAATAQKDKDVVVIHGDGGFRMVAMDLLTAVEHELRLRVIVLDDGHYGLIRHQQLASGLEVGGTELPLLGYESLAAALGVAYADASDGLDGVFELCERVPGSVLIRQPIVDSVEQRRLFRKMGIRGTIRRAMNPRLLEFLRGLKKR